MRKWTRREVLKSGVVVSAGLTTAAASIPGTVAAVTSSSPALPLPENASPRERLLMDFGWRFHLGHA